MKTNKTMRKRPSSRAALLLLMLLTTTTAWATITGSGTSTDPYVINNVSDWNTATQNSTYNSAGVYVALGADLDFGNSASNSKRYGWRVTSGSSYATTCQMHFDGKGHTISGFKVDSSDSYVALFTELGQGGTITNLTVASSTLVGNQWVGGIVGRNMGTISNCHVESTVTIKAKENGSQYCGGIVDLYANWTDGSVTLPTPTKTGYTFAGWYSDEGLTVKVGDAGASYKPSANKTLYAKWTVHHYTVQCQGLGRF